MPKYSDAIRALQAMSDEASEPAKQLELVITVECGKCFGSNITGDITTFQVVDHHEECEQTFYQCPVCLHKITVHHTLQVKGEKYASPR